MTCSSVKLSNGFSRANVSISQTVTANDQISLFVENLPCIRTNNKIVKHLYTETETLSIQYTK